MANQFVQEQLKRFLAIGLRVPGADKCRLYFLLSKRSVFNILFVREITARVWL